MSLWSSNLTFWPWTPKGVNSCAVEGRMSYARSDSVEVETISATETNKPNWRSYITTLTSIRVIVSAQHMKLTLPSKTTSSIITKTTQSLRRPIDVAGGKKTRLLGWFRSITLQLLATSFQLDSYAVHPETARTVKNRKTNAHLHLRCRLFQTLIMRL